MNTESQTLKSEKNDTDTTAHGFAQLLVFTLLDACALQSPQTDRQFNRSVCPPHSGLLPRLRLQRIERYC